MVLNRSGQIPIDTENPHATLSSLGGGVKALRAGMPLFVFPEGPERLMATFRLSCPVRPTWPFARRCRWCPSHSAGSTTCSPCIPATSTHVTLYYRRRADRDHGYDPSPGRRTYRAAARRHLRDAWPPPPFGVRPIGIGRRNKPALIVVFVESLRLVDCPLSTAMTLHIAIPEPTSRDTAYNQRSLPQYIAAIQSAGALATVVPLHERQDRVARLLAGVQGILLPGSGYDRGSASVRRSAHSACTIPTRRAAVDELLLQDAFNLHKPILAICHGSRPSTSGGTAR